MTAQQLLREGAGRLERAGVPEPLLDARCLLMEAFQISLARLLADQMQTLTPEKEEAVRRFETLFEKRARRVPLQQLTGSQIFMGFAFMVNEHVLVPRQDTETLVELVLADQKRRLAEAGNCGSERLLDLCTGSGCIAVSLALLGRFGEICGLDVSPEALAVAGENAARLLGAFPGSFRLVQSDMFEALEEGSLYDVIVSNPPYIPSQVIESLEPEVRDFEPRLALDGSADGLRFYRILAEGCRDHLPDGGMVYMEIGYDQGESVSRLFADGGYQDIQVFPDMAGHSRVVRAVWRDPGHGVAENG